MRGGLPLLAIAVLIAVASNRTDPDLWGHVRFGQAIIESRHLIRTDHYSYTAAGMQWRNHEWLTEVVMAAVYNHAGVAGLKLWRLTCASALFFGLACGLQAAGASLRIQANLLIIAAVALMPQMQFRPQLFTFALFTTLLMLLARHTYEERGRLWLIVPIMAVWANLHGAFIAGLGTLAIYTVGAAARDLIEGKGFARAIGPSVITIAGTAATLLTPYGFGTWIAVTRFIGNPMTRIAISDWQPLVFHAAQQWRQSPASLVYFACAVGLTGLLVASIIIAPTIDDLPLVAIALAMSAAALIAVRNIPLAVIAGIIPTAHHLSRGRWARSNREPDANAYEATDAAFPRRTQAIIWAAAAALTVATGTLSSRLANDQQYPAGAVAFLESRGLHGNILAKFGWAQYLIWHAPRSRYFIDGRYDTVFPGKIINDYLTFYFDLPGARNVLASYPHDFILVAADAPAVRILASSPRCRLIYRDRDSVLYARADSRHELPEPPASSAVLAGSAQFFP